MRDRWIYAVVIGTVAINSLGIGLIIPVMPVLLLEMGVPTLAEAASIGGMLSLVFALMQFLFAPMIGRLSDRYGRRTVLVVSLLAVGIDYAILAVAGSLWLFFVARMVSGIASAIFSVANAVLADVPPLGSDLCLARWRAAFWANWVRVRPLLQRRVWRFSTRDLPSSLYRKRSTLLSGALLIFVQPTPWLCSPNLPTAPRLATSCR